MYFAEEMKFIASTYLFITVAIIAWVNSFQTLKIQAAFYMRRMVLYVVAIREGVGLV